MTECSPAGSGIGWAAQGNSFGFVRYTFHCLPHGGEGEGNDDLKLVLGVIWWLYSDPEGTVKEHGLWFYSGKNKVGLYLYQRWIVKSF